MLKALSEKRLKNLGCRNDSLTKNSYTLLLLCCRRHPSGIIIHQVNPGTAGETSHPSSAVFIMQSQNIIKNTKIKLKTTLT
ncbi:hypothetical protein GDO78_006145 [Eleutherodactylus coqui]|uniref:Uncharacterized protein n=1 Tax=Eleutherodactylus coqui TaxID=57060 RepID=A0A8J6FN92_ELECQ|nr:hypothetical protein GDO78_006145 [Eleutherodactylus coqui]